MGRSGNHALWKCRKTREGTRTSGRHALTIGIGFHAICTLHWSIIVAMKLIRIRFADGEGKRAALGFFAGRFSFTSYNTGEVLVVEDALAALAVQGISFTVEGPATYAEAIPAFRVSAANPVQ